MSERFNHPRRTAPATVLEAVDLSVTYGESSCALAGASMQVRESEVVALLGANGAGKSTLVRALTGALSFHGGRITGGTLSVLGAPVAASTAQMVRRGVSQVMEGRHVFADLTVADNLQAGAHICRSRREINRRYDEVLARFPALQRREQTAAGYLSGGEQQMLAIGRALMQKPKLLLLDEPSLGLAPVMVKQVRDLIAELNAGGTTILLIEQNVAMALSVASRAYVLESGRVSREGQSADLAGDDGIRRAYLGVQESAR